MFVLNYIGGIDIFYLCGFLTFWERKKIDMGLWRKCLIQFKEMYKWLHGDIIMQESS